MRPFAIANYVDGHIISKPVGATITVAGILREVPPSAWGERAEVDVRRAISVRLWNLTDGGYLIKKTPGQRGKRGSTAEYTTVKHPPPVQWKRSRMVRGAGSEYGSRKSRRTVLHLPTATGPMPTATKSAAPVARTKPKPVETAAIVVTGQDDIQALANKALDLATSLETFKTDDIIGSVSDEALLAEVGRRFK